MAVLRWLFRRIHGKFRIHCKSIFQQKTAKKYILVLLYRWNDIVLLRWINVVFRGLHILPAHARTSRYKAPQRKRARIPRTSPRSRSPKVIVSLNSLGRSAGEGVNASLLSLVDSRERLALEPAFTFCGRLGSDVFGMLARFRCGEPL
jgi:hypothetical protein